MDSTLSEFLNIIAAQVQKGINKYGGTVDQNPSDAVAWIDHAVQEQVDNIFYLLRLKRELLKRAKPE